MIHVLCTLREQMLTSAPRDVCGVHHPSSILHMYIILRPLAYLLAERRLITLLLRTSGIRLNVAAALVKKDQIC